MAIGLQPVITDQSGRHVELLPHGGGGLMSQAVIRYKQWMSIHPPPSPHVARICTQSRACILTRHISHKACLLHFGSTRITACFTTSPYPAASHSHWGGVRPRHNITDHTTGLSLLSLPPFCSLTSNTQHWTFPRLFMSCLYPERTFFPRKCKHFFDLKTFKCASQVKC